MKNSIIRFLRVFSKMCRSCKGKGAVWYTSQDIRKKYCKICHFERCPFFLKRAGKA